MSVKSLFFFLANLYNNCLSSGVPAPGLSSTAAGGICTTVVLVLLVAAVFGIYHWHRSRKTGKY